MNKGYTYTRMDKAELTGAYRPRAGEPMKSTSGKDEIRTIT